MNLAHDKDRELMARAFARRVATKTASPLPAPPPARGAPANPRVEDEDPARAFRACAPVRNLAA